jgi:hypothetical protein
MIFFDLFVWVNILRFVRNKHLLPFLSVNTDFRQIVNDELSSRRDHKDVWFQKKRFLYLHYEKFIQKGGVVSKFHVSSCGLIFVIFHYFDKQSGKQIYNFVVISENHHFLLKEFQLLKKQKKPLHFEFKYYPFLQELLITSNYSDNVDLPSMLINLTTMRYDLQTDKGGWKSAYENNLNNIWNRYDVCYSPIDLGNIYKLFDFNCYGDQYSLMLKKSDSVFNFFPLFQYEFVVTVHSQLTIDKTIEGIYHFPDFAAHWLIKFRNVVPTYESIWKQSKFVYVLMSADKVSVLHQSTLNLEPVYEKSTKRFYFYHITNYNWQLNKIHQL